MALILVHVGSELLDDVTDGDIGPTWQGRKADEIVLAAVTLCTTLSQLALAELDAPLAVVHAMQRTLARGLLAMAGGQARDIAQAGSANVRSADVEAAIAGKAGGALGMYAALGAQLAGASTDVVDLYAEVGRSIGIAAQIRSECWDLFQAPFSRDLKAGTRTLPLSLYLERLASDERDEFLLLLDDARGDVEAQRRVRERVSRTGSARTCAIVIETYLQRAREALAKAHPRKVAGNALLQMIARYSLLERRTSSALAGGSRTRPAPVPETRR
jgi:geranylgeranyl pyrophosphate synthase